MTDMPGIRSGSAPPAAGDGFALVEMFTSQGCNSCPPAEDVLSEIDRDARERGSPVYALGFHVDYWDHLGWADPFGAEAHTLRQEAYARQAGRLPERAVLNVAVVERGLENDVPRGENAGRRLRQDNVVRAFTSTPLNVARGRIELEVPPALDPRHASVVGYVQNDGDKTVVGAASVDVSAGRRA